jgi:hypothetical protein
VYLLYVAGYIGDMLINAYFTIWVFMVGTNGQEKPQNQIIYR